MQKALAIYQISLNEQDDPKDVVSSTEKQQDGPLSPEEPGQQIGPYLNCTHHATGLFSKVYRYQPRKSQALAIKLTSPGSEQPPHNSAREARLLRLATHPNVISLLSTRTLPHSSSLLLVFPFQPLDLATRLVSPSPLPSTLLQNIFSALAHLHEKGILHRDLKPANILLTTPSGPTYLADFGIAWHGLDPGSEPADEKITDVGTTCYRAPELLFGSRNYSTGVDLWAAGCVAAEVYMHVSPYYNKEWTLFDAGELGSELALIKSQFETLGTPEESTWPEARGLPDWGKMQFVKYPSKGWEEILPGVSKERRALVGKLVKFESGERMSAKAVQTGLGDS